jgi:hypothetical protein
MSVPSNDLLCRFIKGRSDSWNEGERRPRPSAFKDKREPNFSTWNVVSLVLQQSQIDDLMTGTFRGYGQAYLTVEDCLEAAMKAAEKAGKQFDVVVEWRPDAVPSELKPWAYAHVQVEYPPDRDLHSAIVEFRQLLATKSRDVVPPERYRRVEGDDP